MIVMLARRYNCRHVTILQALSVLFPAFIYQQNLYPSVAGVSLN